MFGGASSGKTAEMPSFNHIQADTVIVGDIQANGNLRIDGTLKGSVKIQGKLVLGATGKIEGDISCVNADVSGSIDGKINVAELLSLKSSAKLIGDIITSKLSIEPGADFSGSCKMSGVIKDIKNGERPEQQAGKAERTA